MEKFLETPVFLTFFVKYQTLEKVFQAIREVKPKTLFLVGDGPRSNRPDDVENVIKCKRILENIDWKCDVHRYYAESNRGILVNGTEGLEKAFQLVDRVIFLEDDMLPSKSFFYYCEELLEKYKNDTRVLSILGQNFIGEYKSCESDYFFARILASGATAFWKRSWEELDHSFEFIDDNYIFNCMNDIMPKAYKYRLVRARRDRKALMFDGLPKSSELKMGLEFYLQNRVNIVPKYNMIQMLGVTKGSEHTVDDIRKLPKKSQKEYLLEASDLVFPLKHPKYMTIDMKIEALHCPVSKWKKLFYNIEKFFRTWRYGSFSEASAKLNKNIKRFLNNKSDINGEG